MPIGGFPLKDLKRRRRQTTLSVLALSLVVTGAVFVVITSENLDLRIRSLVGGRLNIGFVRVFFDFTSLMIALSVLTGAVMTYFLTSICMSERRKDIGIMKAVGCLPPLVFGYFAAELGIIVSSSCAIGIGLGLFSPYLYTGLDSSGFLESPVAVSPWLLVVFSLVFVLVSILLGIQPIVRAIRTKSSEVLAPRLRGETRGPRAFTSKLSFSFRIAYRTLLRKEHDTAVMTVCFALVMVLTTMMIAGATIVKDTTQSYIERAIGPNVILVSHPTVSSHYVDLLSLSESRGQRLDFLDPEYRIAAPLLSELGRIPGVGEADPRLVFEARVYEVQGVAFVGEGSKEVVFLGDHRSSSAMVHGIEPEHVVNDWLMWGRAISAGDVDSVVLGDTLASEIISHPSEQQVEIQAKRFGIAGVALDPFNAGLVVYAPMSSISPLINQTGCNLLLLQAGGSDYSDVVAKVRAAVSGSGLGVVELDTIIEEYEAFFGVVWSPYVLLSLSFLGATIFCLFGYTSLHLAEQEADLRIMRALGTKPRRIITIVMVENIVVALLGGGTGVVVGFLVVFCGLMPNPVLSSASLLSVVSWLLFGLGLLCFSGFYSAFRARAASR